MKLHLFGLPISTHRRLEAESDGWKDAVPEPHRFRPTPISTNEYARFTEGEIKELAGAVSEGFTHIVIPANRDWKIIQTRFQFDCRVHIARLWEPLRDISWDLLKDRLHAAVKLDEIWLDKVSPADLRHALLLPPTVFSTTRKTERYWHRCDVYSEEQIWEAEQLLDVVDKEHRVADGSNGRSWRDGRMWRYRIDHSKHGTAPTARAGGKTYRFCYEVPPTFHYDVTEDGGSVFSVEIDGKSQKLAHCNITPWGHVRRG